MNYTTTITVIVVCFVLLMVFFYLVPVSQWIQCILNGVRISLLQLVAMRLRKVPPSIIVNAMINSKKAGLNLSSDLL
ncbi:MAG: flotillin-like FloA family protein, partial [Bacteroidales bacterium]|nr:flotillin-like FloA family protein [Bacteroidales bacterium]